MREESNQPAAASQPPSPHDWDACWYLRESECSWDVRFVKRLNVNRVTDAATYDFRSSRHHVGIECAKPMRGHAALGITAAPRA